MDKTPLESGIVSVKWLAENLHDPNVKILDGTWSVTKDSHNLPGGVIPGAMFFDLRQLKSVSVSNAAYPSQTGLLTMIQELGLKESDTLIIYDRHGVFSSPRICWSLKTVGHANTAILNGGLPAWIKSGHKVVEEHSKAASKSDYTPRPTTVTGVTLDTVLDAIGSATQIVDARSAERFLGTSPEPRDGLRSGHIPGSLSLPLSSLNDDTGQLLNEQNLRAAIHDAGINMNYPIITSCGSGVTAAALALIFHSLGKTDVAVYTGSWTEYGATDHPIETG